jgi:hypothetical protein
VSDQMQAGFSQVALAMQGMKRAPHDHPTLPARPADWSPPPRPPACLPAGPETAVFGG